MKLYPKRDKRKSGIYCIRNIQNQKVYIGKAKDIYKRLKAHITALNTKNKDENPYLINSWHKYGKESFEYVVLEYLELDEKLISERELFWQKAYDATNPKKGYNLRLDSSTGMILSNSTRIKLSIAQKKRCENPEHIKNLWENILKYRKSNPDWIEKMAKSVSKTKKKKHYFEQYTKDLQLVRIWDSVEDILSENPNYKWQNIYSVCNGYKPSIYGYIWKKKLKI